MQKKHKKVSPGMVLIYVVLSIWAVTTIYPILWVVLNSFKVKDKIMVDSFALPLGNHPTDADADLQRRNQLRFDGFYSFAGCDPGDHRLYFPAEIYYQGNDCRSCQRLKY